MSKTLKRVRSLPWSALSFLGALTLIVTGVALVYVPAALVVAGTLVGALAWTLEASK